MSRDTQIEVYSNGETHTLYVTCGHSQCNQVVLAALGVEGGRYSDETVFHLGENRLTIAPADEQTGCTWCFGCGDFLEHGLSCDCKARGYDPEQDREPLEPMVHVNGLLELRPFTGQEAK